MTGGYGHKNKVIMNGNIVMRVIIIAASDGWVGKGKLGGTLEVGPKTRHPNSA
jgi:hypothetical protein